MTFTEAFQGNHVDCSKKKMERQKNIVEARTQSNEAEVHTVQELRERPHSKPFSRTDNGSKSLQSKSKIYVEPSVEEDCFSHSD